MTKLTEPNLTALLDGVGAHFGWPVEYWRAFGREWARNENTDAQNNPLATTRDLPGDADTSFNSVGVRNYPTLADGIEGTIETLALDYYQNIRRAISESNIAHRRADIVRELRTWGTNDFADEIAAGWNPDALPELGAPPTTPDPATFSPTMADLRQELANLNQAVLIRFGLVRDALHEMQAGGQANAALIDDIADPEYFNKHP